MDDGLPDDVDGDLWVVVEGIEGRCYLVGNGHTHRGRMAAWSSRLGRRITLSKDEIEEAAPKAETWIDGFLAGNEPPPEELFGPSILDADDADPRWTSWRMEVRGFRDTGRWPHRRHG
jgi:hypothetical protein